MSFQEWKGIWIAIPLAICVGIPMHAEMESVDDDGHSTQLIELTLAQKKTSKSTCIVEVEEVRFDSWELLGEDTVDESL